MQYRTWIDPRASVTRNQMRQQAPKDLAGATMRLALHLSDVEHQALQVANPDTLGLPVGPDQDAAWAKFIAHPDSAPYRVNKV
jgi:hypothetical protein